MDNRKREKVAVLGIQRQPGWWYYPSGTDVRRQRRGAPAGAAAEVVRAGAFTREPGAWSYFLDQEGDVSRVALGGSRRKHRRAAKRPEAKRQRDIGPPIFSEDIESRLRVGEVVRIEIAGILLTIIAPATHPRTPRRAP